jgi:hypothetical protein
MTLIKRGDEALAVAGLLLGLTVTRRLHRDPRGGFWTRRIGQTRFRRADLPVGGSIGLLVAGSLPPGLGHRVRALSLGAALAPPLMGLIDPLRHQ